MHKNRHETKIKFYAVSNGTNRPQFGLVGRNEKGVGVGGNNRRVCYEEGERLNIFGEDE